MKITRDLLNFLWNTLDEISKKSQQIKMQNQKELDLIENLDKKISDKKKWTISRNLDSPIFFWISWLIVLYLWYSFYISLNYLYLLLTAFILSMSVEFIVERFEKIIWRTLWVLFSYLIILIILIISLFFIVPFIFQQSADIITIFISKLLEFQTTLKEKWLEFIIMNSYFLPWFIKSLIVWSLKDPQIVSAIQNTIQENLSQFVWYWSSYITNIWSLVIVFLKWFVSAIFQIILVFVLAIFFSFEKDWVIKVVAFLSWKEEFVSKKLEKLYKKLWFRLKWQIIMCFFIWITVFLMLNLVSFVSNIDIPYKITLSIIAWITEFVPMIWPIIWAIPAILVGSIAYWFTWFFVIAIIYYLIQSFENNVLIPIVMNRALWLSPLLIFIAMILWWSILWFYWIILSVPLAVIINLFFEDFIK